MEPDTQLGGDGFFRLTHCATAQNIGHRSVWQRACLLKAPESPEFHPQARPDFLRVQKPT